MNIENISRPLDYHSDDFDFDMRTWLTHQEIADIAETALLMENPMEQDISIMVNVIMTVLLDEEDKKQIEDMPIDDMMLGGLWSEVAGHVTNLERIFAYINHQENAGIAVANFFNKIAPRFLNDLDKSLDKYVKRLPKGDQWNDFLKNTPQMLNEIMDTVKEDGNAEIIKGALKMGGDE